MGYSREINKPETNEMVNNSFAKHGRTQRLLIAGGLYDVVLKAMSDGNIKFRM